MQNPFVAIDSRLRIIEDMLIEIKQTAQKQPQPAATPPDDPERLISKKEAAKLLSCSQSTIDNYRRDGQLKAQKLGRKVLFRRGDVLAVVQPNEAGE